MSLIDGKLNQTVTYKRFLRTDAYGKALYADPVEIRCRLQDDRQLVRDESGREVVSESVLFVDFVVAAQDAVVIEGRSRPFIRVASKVDLDGDFSHCEVRL